MRIFRKKILESVMLSTLAIGGANLNEVLANPPHRIPGSQPVYQRYNPASYPHRDNSDPNNKSQDEITGIKALKITGALVGPFALYLLYCGYQDYKSKRDKKE